MIRNAVEYQVPHSTLVETYNRRRQEEKDPTYWENAEVTPLRGVIKAHYEREQAYKCCYCGVLLPTSHGRVWDAEHIVPKSSHPQFLFEPENLAVSCIDCNNAKLHKPVLVNNDLVRYPRRSDAFIIVHPHYDNLEEHIGVNIGRIYFAKSAKGEKTIHICRLTRYSYEYLEWDSGLCESEILVEKYNDFMDADPNVQRQVMMELFLIAGVQLSRTLLPAPVVQNATPPTQNISDTEV